MAMIMKWMSNTNTLIASCVKSVMYEKGQAIGFTTDKGQEGAVVYTPRMYHSEGVIKKWRQMDGVNDPTLVSTQSV